MEMRDLGLTYEAAAHGVQSALKYELDIKGVDTTEEAGRQLKHNLVGNCMRAADAGGLAMLLIEKGVFTEAEYIEAMRLAANEELVRMEEHMRSTYGLDHRFSFR